ncbi:hypothetical protein CHLRE_06g250050v5 [Chlamydomonas reinhardtii]|uniref:Uncharacterized protein n=1 Tax=Chlamydomonas reinhardtii TaxID=3055 RepID=A0A2K3DLV2_CHLRE|nr:uncharacterized protein CHLRE_06g250050v5 [Chlamydomonas reinhardtii]PNW81519.1 hypothetical protein CHLRE_06g250050v5 [Chlamydomonas reinhardtii]
MIALRPSTTAPRMTSARADCGATLSTRFMGTHGATFQRPTSARRRPAVVAASQLTPAAPTVVSGKVADLAAKRAIGRAAKSVLMLSTSNTQPGVNESDARTTTAEAVVAAARTVCAGLTDDQLLAALKLAYAHAGPARALSLAALARRGSAMLAATAHAALREGCAVAEKRQLLLEVLGGDSAMTLGLKGALIQLQPGPSAAATPASEPVTADSSTPETATAAAAPTEATRGTSWFRRRVQQLSAAELDGLMAEGGWLDPVMTRLRTALKASGWIVMMATAAKISPTLVEVLRRTPCPAAAPREHTVQAIARLLVSNGLARAQAHVWPLTAQRILGLIHEYQRLLKAPEEQLARRGLTKLELQLELVCNIHNASHSQDVSRTALSKAVRIAVSGGIVPAPVVTATAPAAGGVKVGVVLLAEAGAATAAPAAAAVHTEVPAAATVAATGELAEAAGTAIESAPAAAPERTVQPDVLTAASPRQVHADAAALGAV